jgi:maleylacetate reductase
MHRAVIEGGAVERVTVGTAAADAVAGEAQARGAQRVFLLVSTHLETQTDEIARIRRALGSRHAATHHGVRAHVPKSDLLVAANRALDVGADLIVVVGGGSVTDAGKILGLCLRHEVRSIAALDALRVGRDADGGVIFPAIPGPDVRVVIVPTTLSAGEFNPLSGATDETRGQKEGFGHHGMTPACVVLDPAITVHTPEWLWLSTGVRAVDHAVETLASLSSNDRADRLAEGGLRLLVDGLPRVKARPDDLEARLKCQLGAWQSVLPLVEGVPMGASHAIGHALGGLCGVPHGSTSCVMAPYVQRWNAEVETHGQARIAACLGSPGAPADRQLHDLISALGLPRTLAEVGVRRDQLPQIAEVALHDIWGRTNPRPVASLEHMVAILDLAGATP